MTRKVSVTVKPPKTKTRSKRSGRRRRQSLRKARNHPRTKAQSQDSQITLHSKTEVEQEQQEQILAREEYEKEREKVSESVGEEMFSNIEKKNQVQIQSLDMAKKIQLVDRLMRASEDGQGEEGEEEYEDFESVSLNNLLKPKSFNFKDNKVWPTVTLTLNENQQEKTEVEQQEQNSLETSTKSWFPSLFSETKKAVEDDESETPSFARISEEQVDNEWNLVSKKALYKDIVIVNRTETLEQEENKNQQEEETKENKNIETRSSSSSFGLKLWW